MENIIKQEGQEGVQQGRREYRRERWKNKEKVWERKDEFLL